MSVLHFYEEIADQYDSEYVGKANYQIPLKVKELYDKYGISDGSILDLGCGTGILKEYLGDSFIYTGIDISPKMIALAQKRGYTTILSPLEEGLKNIQSKSIDHVVALGSLLFVKDIVSILKEIERVARHSYCISLEHSSLESMQKMENKKITLYTHSFENILNPTEIFKDIYLWTSPTSLEKVRGDIVFKLVR